MYKLCDMHVHSHNSHDSNSLITDIAEKCIEKNISVVAITDHCDIQFFYENSTEKTIKNSLEETEKVGKDFSGNIEILKGIEIGEGIWNKKCTSGILEKYDYDVVIGSVHAVRYKNYRDPYSCIDFSKMSLDDVDGYLKKYFDDVLEMVHEIPCDIMAHLTCPLRYINGKYDLNVNSEKYKENILPILRFIIDNNISMEINTSGFVNEKVGFMPDEWIVREFKKMGGKFITLGSDAHIPENVASNFERAMALLKKYEFSEYYYYKNRKIVPCKI